MASNGCCLTGLGGFAVRRKETQARPENGPIPVTVSTVHTQRGRAVCGFRGYAVITGATKFCFSFPGLPSGKPPKLFRSSRVQLCLYCPWPWYSTLITQALTKWRGPPQAQIQVGTTTRRAIVITGSPLWSPCSPESYSPNPWSPAKVEEIRLWDE